MQSIFLKLQLFILLMFFSCSAQAQYKTNHDFMVKRQQIGKSGMIAYTTWSGINLAGGITCWAAMKGEGKYFGQMNVIWSAINLGIAIPGLIGSFKKIPQKIPNGEMIQQQYGSEATYLINGGLDFLYIGTGAFLRTIADNYPKSQARLLGYGDSFLINGAFLLFFDFIQYFRHRHARKSANNLFLEQISMSDVGIGIKYTFK